MLDSQSDLLDKAFQLAYLIHSDKEVAIRIVTESMARLEVAATIQDKRLYYNPTGRTLAEHSSPQRSRNKVSMDEPQLLQRLIYIESEPHEKSLEERDKTCLSEEDMIIRYLKHLMKITIKRNSFYVTLGLCRLLHNYSTAETTDLYSLLVQDPDRARDDYYYRSRKKVLMKEISERFSDFLKVIRGYRGEERFQSCEAQEEHEALVKNCLRMFTPWNTDCVLPERFDPLTDHLPRLAFEDNDPDEEHPVEMNRIHTVIHPECYSQITGSLGFDSPEERLEVPNFLMESGGRSDGRPPENRWNPPALSEKELIGIAAELGERAARRREVSAGLLAIMVDGIERAQIVPAKTSRASFEIEEGAELLEVYSKEASSDVLLATLLLDYDENLSQSKRSSITLEGGQKISFDFTLSKSEDGEISGAIVEIAYEETAVARAASLSWRRLTDRLATITGASRWVLSPAFKAILAFSIVAALALGVWFLALSGNEQSPSEMAINTGKTEPTSGAESPTPAPEPNLQNANQDESGFVPEKSLGEQSGPTRRESTPPSTTEGASNPSSSKDLPPLDPGLTRSARNERVAQSLLDIRKIVVRVDGGSAFNESLRDHLINEMRESRRFHLTENLDEADALFTVKVSESHLGIVAISGQIINADGNELWAMSIGDAQTVYKGISEGPAKQFVRDLLGELKRLEESKKQ